MKKILIIALFATFALVSCNNNSEKSDTHIHEDGGVHENDAHDHSTHSEKPGQASFDVNTGDTIKSETKSSEQSHSHDDGHKH